MKPVPGGQAPPAGGYSLPQHITRTLRLAIPAMLARAGMVILITVDTAMTGHAGTTELAHFGLSLAPFMILMVVGIGMLAGTPILTAQRDGAGQCEACGAIWHVGLLLAGAMGVTGGLLLLAGEPLFLALDQSPSMAAGAASALAMHALGLPPMLLFLATAFFLEGISRPIPGMIIALAANILNVGLNWLLIEGNWGALAMGADGAALATSITRWIMFAALAGYVWIMRDGARFGVRGGLGNLKETIRKALRLGTPLALTTGLEVSAFGLVATFAGRMGEVPMAGYQASMNVVSLVFMLSIGLGAATAVRVANAVGRHHPPDMARAGWTGVGLVLGLMLLLSLGLWAVPGPVADLYSNDPAVRTVMLAGLSVVAIMIIADGAQAVLASAARAIGDVLVPLGLFGVSFWLLGVPLAFWLGLRADYGVPGLLVAMALGLTLAALALGIRFWATVRRGVRPI
jgi:MATE family multidrug resistance protein